MGKGKRILRWLKKRLFRRKSEKGVCKKVTIVTPEVLPEQQDIFENDQINNSDSFSDISEISLDNFMVPGTAVTPDSLSALSGESCVALSQDYHPELEHEGPGSLPGSNPELGMMLGQRRRPPDHWLPPIEECEDTIYQPHALPEPIVVTSRLGNVAFEVNIAKEARPSTASLSSRFSSMSNHKELSDTATWEERMKKMEMNRQKFLHSRCDSLKKRSFLAESVRQRKCTSTVRPLVHGSSLLEELPETPDIIGRSSCSAGVAFEVDTAFHRPKTAKPSCLLKMEQAIEKPKDEEGVSSNAAYNTE